VTFRLGNIPVQVRWSFFIVAVLVALDRVQAPLSLASWLIVVFVSVLFHELGHAFAFIRFGHAPSIELYQMGGVTRGTPGVPTTPGRDALISLAGPLAGFLLGGVVLLLSRSAALPEIAAPIAADLIWVNIGWGLFNLFPIWPLDGGQALVGILRVFSPRRGEVVALTICCIATAAVVVVAFAAGYRYTAFIAGWFGWNGFVRLRWLWSRGADGIQAAKLAEILRLVQAGRSTEAIPIANELIATADNDLVKRDAKHLLAWIEGRKNEGESS